MSHGSGRSAVGIGSVAKPADVQQLVKNWTSLMARSQAVLQQFAARQHKQIAGEEFQLLDHQAIIKAFASLHRKLAENPEKLGKAQIELANRSIELCNAMQQRMTGQKPAPVVTPEHGDRRFNDTAWCEQAMFDYLKQSYLMTSKWIEKTVAEIDDLDPQTRSKVNFYTRQFLSAVSPSNFVLTNPAVLRRAEETNGESLLIGLRHLLDDLARGKGRLKISMTKDDAFELGVNIAASEGKIIYQNALIQLIQYAPTTERAHQIPLLVVPPWINKFYILDLQPRNSLVRWLVNQGHTVFMISWVNPDRRHKDKDFEDYMREGPLAAMDAVALATGQASLNVLSFCIGGILMSATLAYLAAKSDRRVASATLLATMIDLTDVGEVAVFIDEAHISRIEDHVERHGYLAGHHLGDMFSMMRENDLIWSFVTNNYLLGRDPVPFDLLHWNADSTHLPARMLIFYLRKFYLENGLMHPGHIMLRGVPIDLGLIKTPVFALATKDDHIAPWRSCYPAVDKLAGPVEFVLGGSGHIAGIVNPPGRTKYGYWTDGCAGDSERWLKSATYHEGSWWPRWGEWLKNHSGTMIEARRPGGGGLEILEDAPGSYVKIKPDD